MVRTPPTEHCWVIKREITGTMYTIRSSESAANKNKNRPCLIAFKSKGQALQFKRFVKDAEQSKQPMRPMQNLTIERLQKTNLINRCAMASLDLHVYGEMTYSTLVEPTNDFRFDLQTRFDYY